MVACVDADMSPKLRINFIDGWTEDEAFYSTSAGFLEIIHRIIVKESTFESGEVGLIKYF